MEHQLELVCALDDLCVNGGHNVGGRDGERKCPLDGSCLDRPRPASLLGFENSAFLMPRSFAWRDEPEVLLDLHTHVFDIPARHRSHERVHPDGDRQSGSVVEGSLWDLDQVVHCLLPVGRLLDRV